MRSGGAGDASELAYIRWLVTMGLWVVVAALGLLMATSLLLGLVYGQRSPVAA